MTLVLFANENYKTIATSKRRVWKSKERLVPIYLDKTNENSGHSNNEDLMLTRKHTHTYIMKKLLSLSCSVLFVFCHTKGNGNRERVTANIQMQNGVYCFCVFARDRQWLLVRPLLLLLMSQFCYHIVFKLI